MTSIEETIKANSRAILEEPTIYARLQAAYKDLADMGFVKSGQVGEGKNSYKYLPIGDILAAIQKVHAEHRILVLFERPQFDPEHGEKRYTYNLPNKYGGETKWTAANGHIHVRIIGRDEDDMIEMDVPCEAQDNSDKLDNKLLTNAMRSLYRSLYAIEGDDDDPGEDPEARNTGIESEPTEEEKAAIRAAKLAKAQNDPIFGKRTEEAVQ